MPADATADLIAGAQLDAVGAGIDEVPGFWKRLLSRKLALGCLAFLFLLVAIAVVAPVIWPDAAGENAGDLSAFLKGPSGGHILGTDSLGRDVLIRLLVGTRVTLIGVAIALLVALAIGVPFGLAAGFLGGWIDRAVSWLADLTFSIPAAVIILVVLAVFPQSLGAAMVTFGVIVSPGLMRVVRSATLAVRQELYVDAARVAGLTNLYIISRHILPRIAGPVIVQSSLIAGQALLTQTGLAFLNLVVAAPAPSWGGMVANGVQEIAVQPWLIWPPGVAIALTAMAFGLLGDAARDAATEGWGPSVASGARRRGRSLRHPVAAASKNGAGEDTIMLSVRGVSVSLGTAGSAREVLTDVSFSVDAGEAVGIVGESGCGKTLTALSIIGMLPDAATLTGGDVSFDNRNLTALSPRELSRIRGKEIGFISQEPMVSLDPAFRVGSQLAELSRRHLGLSRGDAKRHAVELLQRVQLREAESVAMRYPHELSGGMAQRVSIARALAGQPRILIADEPTTALDVTVQAEVLELLRELRERDAMALLLVTHDWGIVADICERTVVMYGGQVVEQAAVAEIFQEPLHPYTAALQASNPQGAKHGEALPTIRGAVPLSGRWPKGCRFHPRCEYATPECRVRTVPITEPVVGRRTRCIHYDQLQEPYRKEPYVK